MKTIPVSEATILQLNWLVAGCEGWKQGKYMMSVDIRKDAQGRVVGIMVPNNRQYIWFKPTTDWAQGGPIIKQNHVGLVSPTNNLSMFWTADIGYESKFTQFDHDPLVAAMRCYVTSKLGDTVEVPEELI